MPPIQFVLKNVSVYKEEPGVVWEFSLVENHIKIDSYYKIIAECAVDHVRSMRFLPHVTFLHAETIMVFFV